ncbi:MAG: hypothetical protein Q4Q17_04305 [Tissierellia bacterium]|nr:hypothetical protein [Tissierellia bacterium]
MDIQQYVGKTLIGWIYYNENYNHGEHSNFVNRVCYVYPRYILEEEGRLSPIDPNDFPLLGSFEVRIQGGFSSEEIIQRLTHLVTIKLNVVPEEDRNQQNNYYRLKFNPSYGEDVSEVWLDRFKDPKFYQVIRTDATIEEILRDKRLDVIFDQLFTKYIVLKNKEGFFGPFDYFHEKDGIRLAALEANDYHVLKPDPTHLSKSVYRVEDRADNGVDLVLESSMGTVATAKESYDFISDEMLVAQILKTFESSSSFHRLDIEELKRVLNETIRGNGGLKYTKNRLDRIRDIIKKTEDEDDLLSRIAFFLMEDEANQDYVLRLIIDSRFHELEQRASFFIEIREKLKDLEREKQALEAVIESMSVQKEEAEAYLLREHQELSNSLNAKIESLEKTIQEKEDLLIDLSGKEIRHSSIHALDEEIGHRRGELKDLQQMVLDVQKELDQSIADFKSKSKILGHELREEGFQEMLSTIKGLKNFDEDEVSIVETCSFVDFPQMIDYIHYQMNYKENHRISRNMVVNLLLAMGDNSIVNLVGPTGSGKTSTVLAFTKAMGLTEANGRFLCVNIDLDIRSIRDLVGYFNPMTGELVKNNRRLYDMFRTAEGEFDGVAPMVILLDNGDLSTPEHYLSSLLERENHCTKINLGSGCEIEIPKHVRIFTTLAGDHTGMELSRRYYDKTVSIRAEEKTRAFLAKPGETYDYRGAIDFYQLDAFLSELPTIPSELESKLYDFFDLFKGQGIYLSERVKEKALAYVARASKWMNTHAGGAKFLPVELAVLQYLLAGYTAAELGDRMMESLLAESNSMSLLNHRLEMLQRENTLSFRSLGDGGIV